MLSRKRSDFSGIFGGFLLKHESRAIVGQSKRKYWFAVSDESPYLYWYRSKTDVSPLGKIPLSGSAFTFDPRQQGTFEIRCGNEVHILEASEPQIRMLWLNKLQEIRKTVYSAQEGAKKPASSDEGPENQQQKTDEKLLIDISETKKPPSEENSKNPDILDDIGLDGSSSKFYLTSSGKLNERSFELPPTVESDGQVSCSTPGARLGSRLNEEAIDWMNTIKYRVEVMEKNFNEDQQQGKFVPACFKSPQEDVKDLRRRGIKSLSMVASDAEYFSSSASEVKSNFFRKKLPLKFPVQVTNKLKSKPGNCDGCKELISVVESLKERCCDMDDETLAQKEVVQSLKASLTSAKNQIESLKQMSEIQDFSGRLSFILERENRLTHLQLENTEQKRKIQEMQEKNGNLEADLSKAESDLDAYRDSLRSKEELILKLVSDTESGSHTESGLNQKVGVGDSVDLGKEISEGTERELASDCPANGVIGPGSRLSFLHSDSADVIEITDIDNLHVSIKAYQEQNGFLNREVLDLQQMIRGLENRERDLIRKNFDLEAMFFQLKSKYVLLLNHFKPSSGSLDESAIEDMIKDATRWSGLAPMNPELLETEEGAKTEAEQSSEEGITDTLGFYLGNRQSVVIGGCGLDDEETSARNLPKDLLAIATQFSQKSEEIKFQQNQESSAQHIEWLTKWDSFLVSLAAQKILSPTPELKGLIRTGIPHTYRGRVWKSLVLYRVKDTMTELGNGYYESLLKKSLARRDTSFDPSLKQIDLDLARTLPGNRFFTDPDSGKMEQLRKVLYAYRWHNSHIGYCQGLNRIAAVGLLYLEESDAFWFLVACVEHLQPEDYYSTSLVTALADQRVLKDLITEKLPKIANVFRQLETDLTMFTLSWFLTLFVDSLSHQVYLEIIDVFLYEGNKVLFRFGLAALKLCEPQIISCRTAGSLHSCISRIGEHVRDFKRLAHIAFNELNPFPLKHIESRRQYHLNQLKNEMPGRS